MVSYNCNLHVLEVVDIEHLLICLLAMYVVSLVHHLFKSCILLKTELNQDCVLRVLHTFYLKTSADL